MAMDHSPALSSYVQYANIQDLDERLLTFGFNYKLTTSYSVGFHYTFDLGMRTTAPRPSPSCANSPSWKLVVLASINGIDNDRRLGLMIVPDGLGTNAVANLFPHIPIQN